MITQLSITITHNVLYRRIYIITDEKALSIHTLNHRLLNDALSESGDFPSGPCFQEARARDQDACLPGK